MPEPLDLAGMDSISAGVSTFADSGLRYVLVPALQIPSACNRTVVAALICMDTRDGYPTRLFLSEQVSTTARSLNWNTTTAIAGQTWHAFSWNYVQSSPRPVEVLIGHLAAFLP